MKILFAGIIARYPFGGVTWCSLMYLLGLRALGHEVFYIEDTGEVVYDPVLDTRSLDPSYGTSYIHQALEPFGLGDRWSFVNYDGSYHGQSAEVVRRFCADADLFINLSGGSWFWRDEYARIPRSAFIDSDPAFTQLALAKNEPWYVEFFSRFDHLFTFGANIGTPACGVPVGHFAWHKTWQPVTLRDWAHELPADRSFFDGDDVEDRELHRRRGQQGSGVREVHRPSHRARASTSSSPSTGRRPCCANTDGPRSMPWGSRAACGTTASSSSARRRSSASPSTPTYRRDRDGSAIGRSATWRRAARRSCRTRAGQHTCPSGDGLLAFSSPDEALAGIDRINSDYPAHARRALEIATTFFAADRVLTRLLDTCSR